jgi:hypothetical protein
VGELERREHETEAEYSLRKAKHESREREIRQEQRDNTAESPLTKFKRLWEG